ncbi:MAG: hypothetical protein KME16_12745 [Scytolyngbya sp. HA4215-MV1]|nr:hypothetical protein [Scytolyngbya sp. HA4215-MV1]
MKLSILKTVFLTIALFVTTVVLMTEMVLSQPLPLEIAQVPVEGSVSDNPVPQATPTPTMSPSVQPQLSQPSPLPSATGQPQPTASTKLKPPKPSGPYDMEAIKAFNRALYGS